MRKVKAVKAKVVKEKTETSMLLRNILYSDYQYLRAIKDGSCQRWHVIISTIVKFLKDNRFAITVKTRGYKK